MSTVRLDFAVDQAALAAFERSPRTMVRELDRSQARAAQELAREMRRNAPKGESTLTNSIKVDELGSLERFVGPHVQHARYQEEGTEGGGAMPPHSALYDWVRTVGLQPRNPDWDQSDLAWAIAHRIQQEGVPAQPFVEPTVEAFRDRHEDLMRAGVRRGVERAGGGR